MLVGEHELGVRQAGIGLFGRRPAPHQLAADGGLTALEEAGEVELAALREDGLHVLDDLILRGDQLPGEALARELREQRLTERLDLARIVRADQDLKAGISELLLQMRQLPQKTHEIHSCPFSQRAHSSPTIDKEEGRFSQPSFFPQIRAKRKPERW